MRQFPIKYIQAVSGAPAYFTLGGEAALADYTAIFHGKGWINSSNVVTPFYQAQPTGTTLLVATVFDVVGNPDGLDGRYSVYTPVGVGDVPSSEFSSGTKVRVNETFSGTHTYIGNGDGGYVTHISTYLLKVYGESDQLVYEQSDNTNRPLEIVGRLANGWGEVLQQNQLLMSQCWAGLTAPANPYQGQLWYDTSFYVLRIRGLMGWEVVNESYFGKPPFRFTQATASNTWTITHNLGLAAPYIATASFFVDTGSGVYKPIIPSDVTFVNANTLTVTFSNPYTGYAVVRP